ncbi:hypothetical protein O181_074114 [Austropuccinia psidii MF-1]|uniref:Uncharacterized protein n=1 Tax=Austropuccinia psidii MF-1 TaxID=1389203 RepID=A0A9Q3ID54_9BASI|nr:hypothetical protein [Austropuccinia psidii MF-1]
MKVYAYVPHYQKAPKDVSSQLSNGKIHSTSRKYQQQPKKSTALVYEVKKLHLTEEALIKKAFSGPNEAQAWKEEMDQEFSSLTLKKTASLVPPPNSDKVICGIWGLVKNKNEFGKVQKYKDR